MQEIAAIIGAAAGVISLVTVIYFVVYWKAGVDTDRKAWRETCQHYPPAELWTMCKTMWDIYVVNVLQDRPDLAERHSPWKLKPKAEGLIPGNIKDQLEKIPKNSVCREDVSNGWLVVKYIGLNHLTDLAKEKGISIQETVAILSTYLEERNNNR